MKIVLQRCTRASVTVDGKIVGQINRGLLALVGIGHDDDLSAIDQMATKIVQLRIFGDAAGKMNLSVLDVGGEILSVSQFTLMADLTRGRRPAFTDAAPPQQANHLYEAFNESLRRHGLKVETGIFAADMQVELVNDGPVTILL